MVKYPVLGVPEPRFIVAPDRLLVADRVTVPDEGLASPLATTLIPTESNDDIHMADALTDAILVVVET
jgi:hypothetical protein